VCFKEVSFLVAEFATFRSLWLKIHIGETQLSEEADIKAKRLFVGVV